MSSPLFHVTIPPSSLPGHQLYPKLAMVKLEDPQLQPMVEKKGCEKMLASMRDCLVNSHTWDKCNEEFQKFHECINTKYFEDTDTKEIGEDALVVEKQAEMKSEDEMEVVMDCEDDQKDVSLADLNEPEGSKDVTIVNESEDRKFEDIDEEKPVDEEDKNENKDSFRIKIVNKDVEDGDGEDLLFNVSVKSKPDKMK